MVPGRYDYPTLGRSVPGDQNSIYRSPADLERFYNNQKEKWACAEYAIGMAIADKKLGRPMRDAEVDQLSRASGNYGSGWSGGAAAVARMVRSYGVDAQAHPGRFSMDTLDQDLLRGYSAIVDIRNPLTRNGHYIYVAGKTPDGEYIIGDPNGRGNRALEHDRPVTRDHLAGMIAAAPVPGYTTVGSDTSYATGIYRGST